MKTAELIGHKLDAWVARAAGHRVAYYESEDGGCVLACTFAGRTYIIDGGTTLEWLRSGVFHPSVDWKTGGPIIEAHPIQVGRAPDREGFQAFSQTGVSQRSFGSTMLVAAMRCYVAAKCGEELPDDPALP